MHDAFQLAESQFQAYLEWLGPRNPELYGLLIETLSEDYCQVLRAATQIELRFDPPLAACSMGLALLRRERHQEARTELERVIENGSTASPFYGICLITLGQLYFRLKEPEKGEACLRRIREMSRG